MSRILVFNEELPPKLGKALKADAKKLNVTLNDRANAIIAEHYDIPEFSSGAEYTEPTAVRFRLKVPEHVRNGLAVDAAAQGATIRGIALNILAGHYGLELGDARRRPRSAA